MAAGGEVERWLGHIKTYENAFAKWESRVTKILKRYRDDRGTDDAKRAVSFNILWSNVQTLSAATFAKLPKPDVSRRFKDNDPIGRIASLILERALGYEIEHYSDYRAMLKACVLDRFLGGRGTAWARYEPHFKAIERGESPEGIQVTEDVEAPVEELEYECAPLDYVHWKDFGHTVARTWEEVSAVWRLVYMTREALVKRFGEKGETVPLDAQPEDMRNTGAAQSTDAESMRGLVYEIWDKETKQAIWIAKSLGSELDRRDDPLGLEEFFPCPKPIYATLTNDRLEPVPDFTIYQDQADELDLLSARIDGLIGALKVAGVYDGAIVELQRLFQEAGNTQLIPVKNWAAFAEKNGLKGAIDLVDLSNIVTALQQAYMAMEQVKEQVYELTGISDIVRGQSEASETATAQQIKGQYASLRLKTYQEGVAEFSTEALQIKAQIMCNKFSPETLLMISAADQLNVTDTDVLAVAPQLGQAPPPQPQMPGMPPQPSAPPPIATMPQEAKKKIVFDAALKLLMGERVVNPEASGINPMRSFRVDIAADSLIYLDEKLEQEARMNFIGAQGSFMQQLVGLLANAGPAAPALLPVAMELWKFSVTSFKVGKSIEGAFDEATEKLKEMAKQPPPPNPEVIKEQEKTKQAQVQSQAEIQKKGMDDQRTLAEEQAASQREVQMKAIEAEKDVVLDRQEKEKQLREKQMELDKQDAFNRWKVTQDNNTKIRVAQINAEAKAEGDFNKDVTGTKEGERRGKPIDRLAEMHAKTIESSTKQNEAFVGSVKELATTLVKEISKPKRTKLVRGADGRATGTEQVS